MLNDNIPQEIARGYQRFVPSIIAGKVIKVHPKINAVDVDNPNDDGLLDAVPIMSFMGGSKDEGVVSLPRVNDIVLVAFINNSRYDPVVIGRLYSQVSGSPAAIEGEYVMEHRSGTTIKIATDGTVTINSKNVVLHGDSTVGHTHSYTGPLAAYAKPMPESTGSSTDTIVGSGK